MIYSTHPPQFGLTWPFSGRNREPLDTQNLEPDAWEVLKQKHHQRPAILKTDGSNAYPAHIQLQGTSSVSGLKSMGYEVKEEDGQWYVYGYRTTKFHGPSRLNKLKPGNTYVEYNFDLDRRNIQHTAGLYFTPTYNGGIFWAVGFFGDNGPVLKVRAKIEDVYAYSAEARTHTLEVLHDAEQERRADVDLSTDPAMSGWIVPGRIVSG